MGCTFQIEPIPGTRPNARQLYLRSAFHQCFRTMAGQHPQITNNRHPHLLGEHGRLASSTRATCSVRPIWHQKRSPMPAASAPPVTSPKASKRIPARLLPSSARTHNKKPVAVYLRPARLMKCCNELTQLLPLQLREPQRVLQRERLPPRP